jgi:hypothetical protein
MRPPPLLQADLFTRAVMLGNGIMAIASGLVGSWLVQGLGLGPVAPFDAAILVGFGSPRVDDAMYAGMGGAGREAAAAVALSAWGLVCCWRTCFSGARRLR